MTFDISTLTPPDDRSLPWEVTGSTDVSAARSLDEVLETARLKWEVVQEPVYQKMPGDRKYRPVVNRVLNIRADTREVLGIVTPRYNLVQNEDALLFTQELTSEASFSHAGELEGGKLVYVVLSLPDTLSIPGDGTIKPYLLIMNAHDGYRPYSASIQIVRFTCVNQLSVALKHASASWKLKHTGYLQGRASAARETLGISIRYLQRFEEIAKKLATTKLDEKAADMLLRKIFPVSSNATELQIERSQYYSSLETWKRSETLEGIQKTAWGLLNAISEFVDHGSSYRSVALERTEARAESVLFGAGSWKKQAAFNILTAWANEKAA